MQRVGLALAMILLLVACSRSNQEQAVVQARLACEEQTDDNQLESGPLDTAATAAEYERAANRAAQAARLDPAWNELNTAYSSLAGIWRAIAELPVDASGQVDFDRITEAQRARIVDDREQVRADEATIEAECRKVTGP